MYLVERVHVCDLALRRTLCDQMKRVPDDVRPKVAVVEWWGTGFSDPGPDYNLFKFVDAKGNILHTTREEGY